MRNILIIIKKEFRQIFRNRQMLGMMIFMPLLQLLILANAATFEMKNIEIGIVDKDLSSSSRRLIGKISGSKYFNITDYFASEKQAESALDKGQCDLYVSIPNNFEKNLIREGLANSSIIINAIDGSKASIAGQYTMSVVNDFLREFTSENINHSQNAVNLNMMKSINISYANWYNQELNYQTFMVPGLLVLLVSLVGMFIAGMNIVREKEIGTIEQLNVTPIKKHELIIGKLLPFWLIGLFELGFGLVVAKLIYHIPIVGSLPLLFLFGGVFLTVVLGVGFFISTITETQQQSMFVTWFFTIVFILLSGLFTSIENMPSWAQALTYLNPLRYFMEAVRMILLKGSGFSDISFHFMVICIYGVVINSLATLMYRKTS